MVVLSLEWKNYGGLTINMCNSMSSHPLCIFRRVSLLAPDEHDFDDWTVCPNCHPRHLDSHSYRGCWSRWIQVPHNSHVLHLILVHKIESFLVLIRDSRPQQRSCKDPTLSSCPWCLAASPPVLWPLMSRTLVSMAHSPSSMVFLGAVSSFSIALEMRGCVLKDEMRFFKNVMSF